MTVREEPLRILHLASSQRWTGVAEPACGLAMAQIAAGHAAAFAAIGGSSFERRLRQRGVEFAEGFYFNRRLNPAQIRADIRRLRQYVEKHRPHVVHCHLPHDHWLAAMALRPPLGRYAKGNATAIVRTLHREQPPRRDPAHQWLFGKGSDMLICVSSSMRKLLIESAGVSEEKIAWVRGAVDLARFHPGLTGESIRARYKIPAEARVAGLVARMQPHRGHHLMIDALEPTLAAVPEALFALAGRGEIKSELIARIRAHKKRDHLRRMVYHKNDLEEVYAAMDAAALLAPGSDGSCRAMLEAMACGRPVVGARIGAIADAIEPGKNGWLFAPGDKDDLAKALIAALSDLETTKAAGRAAREYVETFHSPERQCRETLGVYGKALRRIGAGEFAGKWKEPA